MSEKKNRTVFYFFAAALLLYIVPLLLDDYPQRDVSMRYIPMSEAFARGDFAFAFHPSVQCLLPLTGGSIRWLTGCDGFTGVKLASLLFFALGVFPLFAIFRRIFTENIALGGVALYIFASKLARIACSGLRDSLKMLVFLLLVMGLTMILEKREQLRGYLWIGIASGLAVCTRNDLILFAVLTLWVGGVMECSRTFRIRGTLFALLLSLAAGLPELIINSHLTGMAVPGSRFIVLFESLFRCPPVWKNVLLMIPVMAAGFFASVYAACFLWRRKWGRYALGAGIAAVLLIISAVTVSGEFFCNGEMAIDYIESIGKGFGSIFIPFACGGIYLRIRKKQWTSPEKLLLYCFLAHQIAVLLQVLSFHRLLYVSDRYLWPAVPLILGWAAFCIHWLWVRAKAFLPAAAVRPVCGLLIAAAAVGFYADTIKPLCKQYTSKKERQLRENMKYFGAVIRADYKGPRHAVSVPLDLNSYKGNTRPLIYFDCQSKLLTTAYYAGGLPTQEISEADYLLIQAGDTADGFEPAGEPVDVYQERLQLWRRK